MSRSTEETPLVGQYNSTDTANRSNTKQTSSFVLGALLGGIVMLALVVLGTKVHVGSSQQQQAVIVEPDPPTTPSEESSAPPLYREGCHFYPSHPRNTKTRPRILQTSLHEASQPWSWKECTVTTTTAAEAVELNTDRAPDALLTTNFSSTAKRGPPILGFGGAFTEATALNFQRLSKKGQATALQLLFDAEHGLGYTLGRVPIHSCDFSVASYTFDDATDDDEDIQLQHFDHTVQHDVDNGMIPMIQRAQHMVAATSLNNEQLRLVASPWSPPAWMKRPTWEDDASAVHASRMTYSATPSCLRGDIRDPHNPYATAWADYMVQWIEAYSSHHGIPIYAVTVQNEPEFPAPWEACAYTAESMSDFVQVHLGPRLRASNNNSTKLLGFDHNKDHAVEWMRTMLVSSNNDTAFVDGTAYHWYAGGMDRLLDGALGTANLHRLRALVDRNSNIKNDDDEDDERMLLGSEACHCPTTGYAGGDLDLYWTRAERYAHTILADLAAGSQGWIEWNLVLDGIGGPNHLGNLCDAPLLAVPHRAVNASYGTPPLPPFERHSPMGKRIVGDDRTREELNSLGFPAEYLDQGIAVQPIYHYTGHISKYVRPGSRSVPGLVRQSFGEGDIYRPVGATVAGGGENNLARNGIEILAWPCEGSTRQQFRWNMVLGGGVPPTISVLGHDWLGNPTESCVGRTNDKDFLGIRLVDCDAGEAGFFSLLPLESSSASQRGLSYKVQLINAKHHETADVDGLCLSVLELENNGGSYGPMGGAQIHLSGCVDDTSTQWHIDVETGVAVTYHFQSTAIKHDAAADISPTEGLCMTTGWPFLQLGSFITSQGEKRTVVLNEAKDAANYALHDGDRIVLTNSIPPRAIQTILLD